MRWKFLLTFPVAKKFSFKIGSPIQLIVNAIVLFTFSLVPSYFSSLSDVIPTLFSRFNAYLCSLFSRLGRVLILIQSLISHGQWSERNWSQQTANKIKHSSRYRQTSSRSQGARDVFHNVSIRQGGVILIQESHITNIAGKHQKGKGLTDIGQHKVATQPLQPFIVQRTARCKQDGEPSKGAPDIGHNGKDFRGIKGRIKVGFDNALVRDKYLVTCADLGVHGNRGVPTIESNATAVFGSRCF